MLDSSQKRVTLKRTGMRTHETIEVKGAVVVTKQALDEMNGILEQVASSLEAQPVPIPVYSGLLSDGTRVEFESFTELAGYPNRTSRRLTRLEATVVTEKEGTPKEKAFKMEVVLGGPTPCVISIDGDQRHSLHARELVKDIIERITAAYSWMYSTTGNILSVLCFVGLLGAPVAWFIGFMADRDHERAVKHAAEMFKINPTSNYTREAMEEAKKLPWVHQIWGIEYWVLALAVGLGLLAFALLAGRLWPRIVFEIGQELDRSNSRKDKRKWLVVSLLLAVPVALLSRFIGSRMGL